ncbi:hypothetical protein ACJJTC_000934 [Scirpophaga incertulas]
MFKSIYFITSCSFIAVGAHDENLSSTGYSSDEIKNDAEFRRIVDNREWQYAGRLELSSQTYKKPFADVYTTETVTTTSVRPPLDPRYRRIYNPDETASVEDFPFMAALLVNGELLCSAAIIDRDTILTAAHCLQLQYNNRFFREYVKMLTVRVGTDNATAGGQLLQVTEIHFHPNYKPETLEFNFAVLKLHKNLTLSKKFNVGLVPLCSKHTAIPTDRNITFLGWGFVLDVGGFGGRILLQKLELPIYELADCQDIYGRDLVTRRNFCAGFITLLKNLCNHDAGGPAIMDGKLVGILSFSSRRCDLPDQPAVFSAVGAIAPWFDKLGLILQ